MGAFFLSTRNPSKRFLKRLRLRSSNIAESGRRNVCSFQELTQLFFFLVALTARGTLAVVAATLPQREGQSPVVSQPGRTVESVENKNKYPFQRRKSKTFVSELLKGRSSTIASRIPDSPLSEFHWSGKLPGTQLQGTQRVHVQFQAVTETVRTARSNSLLPAAGLILELR